MRARRSVISTQTRVCFGRILNRPDIVTHRNHGEQDCKKQKQGDHWQTPCRAGATLKTPPDTDTSDGKHGPSEIEKGFPFSVFRFYITEKSGRKGK